MTKQDILVLGAGASGLYYSLFAARQGLSVTLIDHGPKPGRKVRIAGGGRCNFTNLYTGPEHFISENPHFCKSALARHSPWDVVDFFTQHGITYTEKKEGQLFSDQGGGKVAGILAEQCHRAGVRIACGQNIASVTKKEGFAVTTDQEKFYAPKLVLALGGKSWPQVGATTLGFELAQQFGLRTTPLQPGLVPLVLQKKEAPLCAKLAGIALPAAVSCKGKTFTDDLLFTHRGLSGPAILRAASLWESGTPLCINLLPSKDIAREIQEQRGTNKTLRNFLQAFLPNRIALEWFTEEDSKTPLSQISNKLQQHIAAQIHAWNVTPLKTESWPKAEVTVGGIDTGQISSKTMEAQAVPGLYVVGELLDVTGDLGGHNLHWAWASAHAAAMAASL